MEVVLWKVYTVVPYPSTTQCDVSVYGVGYLLKAPLLHQFTVSSPTKQANTMGAPPGQSHG